jgi:hypothetical protein
MKSKFWIENKMNFRNTNRYLCKKISTNTPRTWNTIIYSANFRALSETGDISNARLKKAGSLLVTRSSMMANDEESDVSVIVVVTVGVM